MKALDINSRTFGVEIEFFGVTREKVSQILNGRGLENYIQSYNHEDSRTAWKLTTDGSVTGDGCSNGYISSGNEIVSPILKGEDGFRQLAVVCEALKEAGAKVDKTCGLHVHLEASDMSLMDWKNTICLYNNFQSTIAEFLPSSRSSNTYCKAFSQTHMDTIMNADSLSNILHCGYYDCIDRYFVVNIEAYLRHGTIEFRQHSGTIEYDKIYNWVVLMMAVQHIGMNTARVGVRHYTADSRQVWNNFTAYLKDAGVSNEVRAYFFNRRKYFMKKEGLVA